MKKYFALTASALMICLFAFYNANRAEAGIFGKYGNLKPTVVIEGDGTIGVDFDCNYSLKSECRRSEY